MSVRLASAMSCRVHLHRVYPRAAITAIFFVAAVAGNFFSLNGVATTLSISGRRHGA